MYTSPRCVDAFWWGLYFWCIDSQIGKQIQDRFPAVFSWDACIFVISVAALISSGWSFARKRLAAHASAKFFHQLMQEINWGFPMKSQCTLIKQAIWAGQQLRCRTFLCPLTDGWLFTRREKKMTDIQQHISLVGNNFRYDSDS